MKKKTLDEALLALNEEVSHFVCTSDRILGRTKDLESENEKLKTLLKQSDKIYEKCNKTLHGWKKMYEESQRDYVKLQEKYSKLQDEFIASLKETRDFLESQ